MNISRTKLRDLSMKLVYQYDFYPNPELDEQTENFLTQQDELTAEDMEAITERMRDIYSHIGELDRKINENTEGWSSARMNKVDLSIIRLALYEIECDPEVPTRVAINEAVELAKQYGGDESPKFVNGVLAKFAKDANE